MNKKHILLIVGITIATFLFVSVRLDIVKTSYKIHAIEKEERSIKDEMSRLTAKINSVQSPQRLEKMAKKLVYSQGKVYFRGEFK